MTYLLDRIQTPEKLILAWEAPLNFPNRTRWAVGEMVNLDRPSPTFRYFGEEELQDRNGGRSLTQLSASGFVGYPAFRFSPGRSWDGEEVLKAFLRRLPDPKRSDYEKYLANFCIPSGKVLSPFQLMSITELRSPNDGFSMVDPLCSEWTSCDLILELAGTRHYISNIPEGFKGKSVILDHDVENPFDDHAVQATVGSQNIGYINRLQAKSVLYWLSNRLVEASLLRVNGTPHRPRPYVFLRVRPSRNLEAA
ncbi:hypothetical protein [Maricaulis maris]|uniref:HIRAN domain-containing protein n=1 Tax=Maricaulis maris TaxID=74318 RepID=A0A495DLZ2_9PROT|nr:hypothetical protein [Maricaulis maris]RKR03938.1 hypothetical protein C7435_0381 [Maricaulis maris]